VGRECGKRKANGLAAQMQIRVSWSSTSCRPRCLKVEAPGSRRMDQNVFVGSFELGSGLSLRT
jgi:hypothetical protein